MGHPGLPLRHSWSPRTWSGRNRSDVLVLVGTVRVGARAEECEGESNDEGSGAHVCCVLSCLSNARSEVWAYDEPDEVGHVIILKLLCIRR